MKKYLVAWLGLFCITLCTVQASDFVKLSATPATWSGEYLIVYEPEENTGNVFDGSLTTLDVASNFKSVQISGTTIKATDNPSVNLDDITFEIVGSGENITIKSKSGYYIGSTGKENELKNSKTEEYKNNVTIADGEAVIIASSGAHLRFNAASNQMRFRYYKSSSYTSQKAISLYAKQQKTFSIATPTLTPEANKVAENGTFTEPFTLTIAGAEGKTIKYTLDGTDPTTSTTTQTYTKPITISKSTKVNAIATDGTETSDKASATYVLLNSEQTAYTATECIELIDNNIGLSFEYYAKGTIKSIEQFNETYGSLTYYITDGTNDLQVYSGLNINGEKFTGADGLQVGGQVVVKGVLKKYQNTYEFDKNNVIISYQAPDKTSVENTSIIAPKTTKVLENGQIIILTPEGKKYNIGGQAIQ